MWSLQVAFLDAQASLAPTLTKCRDDIVVVDMVADMEVDMVTDMVADKKKWLLHRH